MDAGIANDDTAILKAEKSIEADASKLSGYNYDKIQADIAAYYQPLVASFNSEMAQATA